MKLPMYLLQTLLIYVRVDLGRGDVGMAEHFLDHPQIRPVVEEVGGKGMTKEMGVDVGA